MTQSTAQQLESYIPVYDTVPYKWEDAHGFLVEQFKKIANAVNIRTIGWLLDEELLSGQQFIPRTTAPVGEYRSILRKVINTGALVAGVNAGVNHGVTFDTNFTLIDLWVSGTNSGTLTARRITGNDVLMNATQIVITSPQIFDRSFCVIEYIREL